MHIPPKTNLIETLLGLWNQYVHDGVMELDVFLRLYHNHVIWEM